MHEFGEERMAQAKGIELCFQEMGEPDGEPLVLVMGLATQMIAWQDGFCRLLADRGYRVIRFDNRDIGRSTKIDSAGIPGKLEMLTRRRPTCRATWPPTRPGCSTSSRSTPPTWSVPRWAA